MEKHNFATLISTASDEPLIAHVPVLVDETTNVVRAHVARANPIWRDFTPDHEVLIIFHGPHHYVSPNWYASHPSVPTWNYAVVHVSGFPHIIEGRTKEGRERIVLILRALVDRHEAKLARSWKMDLPADYMQQMIDGIVAFEIRVTRIAGKFKLSQNRPSADRPNVIAALLELDNDGAVGIAHLMEELFQSRDQ
jgi:transcriptional regulator